LAVLKSPKNNKNKKLWIKSKVFKSSCHVRKASLYTTNYSTNAYSVPNTWKSTQNKVNKDFIKNNLKLLYSSFFVTS